MKITIVVSFMSTPFCLFPTSEICYASEGVHNHWQGITSSDKLQECLIY